MALSNEDNLRLNVLCSQPVKAIRINESSMLLTALTDKGEARIALTPNQNDDRYLREIREFLSEKYLGMPGGFPRHLSRWTRMGDANNSADKMLLLGEAEAIVALAYSNNVSAEQAEYAWWAYQSPEIARNLLKSPAVAQSEFGQQLAAFLLEFLPFEEKPLSVVESVQMCLQYNLISEAEKADLWARAKRKNPFFVGFLLAGPTAIPLKETAHCDMQMISEQLSEECKAQNNFAEVYLYFLSAEGRKWLKSLQLALKKPTDPDVVIALFITIDQSIELAIAPKRGARSIHQALEKSAQLCHAPGAPTQIQSVCKQLKPRQIDQFSSMLLLAQLGEHTLNDVFGGCDASGSVMRKHLKPLIDPINTAIDTLLK